MPHDNLLKMAVMPWHEVQHLEAASEKQREIGQDPGIDEDSLKNNLKIIGYHPNNWWMGSYKIKNLQSKGNITKMKRQSTGWEKVFANYISYRKIDEEL